MKVVIDANLPSALAGALHALAASDEHSVLHVDDLAGRAATDLEIFQAYAAQKIDIHITQDHHHRRAVELDAIASSGLIVFVLSASWSSQQYWPKAANLVRWWPLIIEHASRSKPPAIFRVPWKIGTKGKFEQIRNTQRRQRRAV